MSQCATVEMLHFIELVGIIHTMSDVDIQNKIREVLIAHGIKKADLFGSFARGNAHADSDVDVLVEVNNMDLFDFVGLKQELEDAVARRVDLVQYKTIKPALRDSIFRSVLPILSV